MSWKKGDNLRSQIVTANISFKSGTNPYVFTEQGIYMLVAVLKGELVIQLKTTSLAGG